MTHDIRGLEQWTQETHEYNREYGKLKMRAGVGIIDALENWYSSGRKVSLAGRGTST
jgi:hypothetical protein